MQNWFCKSQALGNDYIVVEASTMSFVLTPEAIRMLCDRDFGIGSDGVLAIVDSTRADFGLRIYNPDGSEAEKSGNGLRIAAKFLFEHERTTSTELTIETPGGIAACSLKHARGRVTEVEVDMGKAEFAASKIPVLSASEEIIDEPVQIDGTDLLVTAVSVGNPHCVVLLENLKALNLNEWGPALEHHVLFPNRTNVQFVQVIAPDRVRIVVWERGAGHTKASGSSACAVVATCVRKGLTQRKVSVEMEGGTVDIEVKDDFRILMRGPASEVYMGRISEEFIWALTHKSKVMEPTSSAFV